MRPPRLQRAVALAALLLLMAGCAARQSAPSVPAPTLERIAENVWVHKSWANVPPWGLVLSQGLVVKGPDGVTLVDTAWTNAETEQLLQLIEDEVGAKVSTVIVTHAHGDKMGGMEAVHRHTERTYALALTNEDAPSRGLTPARNELRGDETVGGVEVFYPGPGHTRDNLVVYHRASRVLFGGCLVRPGEAKDLGNTGDADVRRWADSVAAVAARFPDAATVVPSHGAAGGRELLDHTLELARAARY